MSDAQEALYGGTWKKQFSVAFKSALLRPQQDNLKTLEAHAKTAEREQRKAKETTITLQALGDKLDDQEERLTEQVALNQQLQTEKEQLKVTAAQAIAEELVATAQLVRAYTGEDYCHSDNFVFDGRGGTFKISTLEGQCLVHNQGGPL